MNESLESTLLRIRFSMARPGADRIHHVNADDVRVVLSRLPFELWHRLRGVHFNDRALGSRVAGYVNRGHREIALCALPPRISMRGYRVKGLTPEQFGAIRGQKWPSLAIRRFMLYEVFLHEVGHLQIVDENRPSEKLRFAREKLADAFARNWRRQLWSVPFSHDDPVHNPPGREDPGALSF